MAAAYHVGVSCTHFVMLEYEECGGVKTNPDTKFFLIPKYLLSQIKAHFSHWPRIELESYPKRQPRPCTDTKPSPQSLACGRRRVLRTTEY